MYFIYITRVLNDARVKNERLKFMKLGQWMIIFESQQGTYVRTCMKKGANLKLINILNFCTAHTLVCTYTCTYYSGASLPNEGQSESGVFVYTARYVRANTPRKLHVHVWLLHLECVYALRHTCTY